MQFIDAAEVEKPRLTADGYLVADARIVRTGIQIYAGIEVGKPEKGMVRVYRPEAEVFHRDSLASFSHLPITDDHPAEAVTADNWASLAKGETGDEVLRDGQRLRIPLIVKDAAAVKTIQDGKRELSAGYSCELSFEDGVTPEGEAYDAIQKNIRANHLAIVQRGRAGSECRIGDGADSEARASNWGAAPLTTDATHKEGQMAGELRKVMVDGLQVETTDAGAQAIEKLTKDKDALAAKLTDAETAHKTAIAAKDEEIGTLKADKKKLEDAAMTPDKVTKLVADRVALESTAKAIFADAKTESVSDADLRKSVVVAKYGADFVGDASEGEIAGMFKALAKDAKVDPVAAALRDANGGTKNVNDNGQAAYEARLSDAWKKGA